MHFNITPLPGCRVHLSIPGPPSPALEHPPGHVLLQRWEVTGGTCRAHLQHFGCGVTEGGGQVGGADFTSTPSHRRPTRVMQQLGFLLSTFARAKGTFAPVGAEMWKQIRAASLQRDIKERCQEGKRRGGWF